MRESMDILQAPSLSPPPFPCPANLLFPLENPLFHLSQCLFCSQIIETSMQFLIIFRVCWQSVELKKTHLCWFVFDGCWQIYLSELKCSCTLLLHAVNAHSLSAKQNGRQGKKKIVRLWLMAITVCTWVWSPKDRKREKNKNPTKSQFFFPLTPPEDVK